MHSGLTHSSSALIHRLRMPYLVVYTLKQKSSLLMMGSRNLAHLDLSLVRQMTSQYLQPFSALPSPHFALPSYSPKCKYPQFLLGTTFFLLTSFLPFYQTHQLCLGCFHLMLVCWLGGGGSSTERFKYVQEAAL